MLQNATQLVDLLRSKTLTSHVAKCDATQSLDSAPLVQNRDSSALTSGFLVSSLVSSEDSLRSSSSLTEDALASLEKQNQNPGGSESEPEEPPTVETDTYWAIANENEIALMLGIPVEFRYRFHY